MTNGIIDFMKHYEDKITKHEKKENYRYRKIFKEISNKLKQSKEEIERVIELLSFAKYSLFLNCLFYNNHNTTNDIKTGFLIGFEEDHLNQIENNICNVLKKLNRPYIVVNAKNKTFIKIYGDMATSYFKSREEAHYEVDSQFNISNKVFIIREFSGAKIDSKGSSILGLIKMREKTEFINDTHFKRVHPDSDLIFIDYANFLQKVWDKIGYYLSISAYSQGEKEFSLHLEE